MRIKWICQVIHIFQIINASRHTWKTWRKARQENRQRKTWYNLNKIDLMTSIIVVTINYYALDVFFFILNWWHFIKAGVGVQCILCYVNRVDSDWWWRRRWWLIVLINSWKVINPCVRCEKVKWNTEPVPTDRAPCSSTSYV